MSALYLAILIIILAAIISLLFSSLTYSLRDFSRPKLQDRLEKLGLGFWLERTVERSGDLIFVTAIGRLFANLIVFIGVLHLLRSDLLFGTGYEWTRYLIAALIASTITLFVSVAIPHALAEHLGETLIAYSVRFLHALRIALLPITGIMHMVDRLVRNLAGKPEGVPAEHLEDEIEQEILSAVEEGEKEGVVDVQEREMIESVMAFVDKTVSQAMTERPDIMGIPVTAQLEQMKSIFAESGHSRLPVYEGSLDKIVGVVYSRDLIRHLGAPRESFDLRANMRPPLFTPQTKPLRDLLNDFRTHKTHIAIVLDEYGGTAGLITIEDLIRELVGEVSDEHEPSEPSLIKRIDENTSEADARVLIEQLNRVLELSIPDDAGYETLGGFVSTTLGRIPEAGACFDHNGVHYTILDAEPQRVNRLKIELPADSEKPLASAKPTR